MKVLFIVESDSFGNLHKNRQPKKNKQKQTKKLLHNQYQYKTLSNPQCFYLDDVVVVVVAVVVVVVVRYCPTM